MDENLEEESPPAVEFSEKDLLYCLARFKCLHETHATIVSKQMTIMEETDSSCNLISESRL